MTVINEPNLSAATRRARHSRLLETLGPLAGPALTISPDHFVNPDLDDPANDRTLLRAKWRDGLEVTGIWAESGGLLGPVFKVHISRDPDGPYSLIHEETLARGAITHTYQIPATDLPWEGNVYLQVSVRINNGADEPSEPFLVRLDRLAPYEKSGIEHPPAPVPNAALVTDADLASFSLSIAGYTDHEAGDLAYIWLENDLPSGALPPLLPPAATQKAGTTIAVPADVLRAKGDGRFYLAYVLADKAGNLSAVSSAAQVTLVLGTLPGTLQAPDVPAADPVIDRADTQAGVYVDVPEMPGWKADDQVTVTFGGHSLPPYTLNPGAFQAIVDVPAPVLLGIFGSADAEMAVDVSYTVARFDWQSAVSPTTTVRLDLSKAGPGNPDWPDPVNDRLPLLAVTSASGEKDEIPEKDLGEAAALTFTIYPEAKEGETVEFFWGATSLETYTLKTADTPGAELDFTVPWAEIAKTLDQQNVEVFYRIRLAGAPDANFQQSANTLVDVSKLPLPTAPVTFPNADDSIVKGYLVMTCEHLVENQGGVPCISINIPDLSQPPYNQQAGDTVTLAWKSFSGTTLDGETPLPIPEEDDGELTDAHVLTAAELTGFTWLVPYDPYGKATYKYDGTSTEGMIQVSYSIEVGSKTAVAVAPDNVVTAFYDSTGPCDASIAGACANCRLG